jgi:catechol 2,3-dioxygenase-like lactoylglutathione lyase family enzyme
VDEKLEVVVIPVSDADRAKEFYANLGWRLDADRGEHEKRIGEADPNWPDWYARYMVAEQAGTELPR